MTNKEASAEEKPKLSELVRVLSEGSIGNPDLASIKDFFRNKKTKRAANILAAFQYTAPKKWVDVGELVWPEKEKREKNKFNFIQGDIIVTTDVAFPGKSPLTQKHQLWIVRTPTCDTIREEYIRLSPVFPIYYSYKKGAEEVREEYEQFRLAVSFLSNYLFPIVLEESDKKDDAEAPDGYYADLRIPAYILEEKKDQAVVRASLSQSGWFLFNGVLQNRETRATTER